MATSSAHSRPRHPSSPFKAPAELIVETYVVDDRVCHDTHGLGRVISVDASGVTVDFGSGKARIATPFRKMSKL